MTSKIKVDNITNQSDSNIVNKCSTTITVGTGSDTTNVPGAAVVTGNVTGANVIASGNVVKSNALQASDAGNIISQSGTTITLGASGDTIALSAGASQTGFGRSGSVNWQTTPKTATFTAADGEGYFINSGSAITMNLPAGSAGAIVAVSDYARNFATYNLTISPNGSEKIGGVAEDATLAVNGQAASFVYVDATKGWVNVQNAEDTETGTPPFLQATGGTITECGNFKIHTFTGPGTFEVTKLATTSPAPIYNKVSYVVAAGGGGAGGTINNIHTSGGGGGGGFREGKNGPVDGYTASPKDEGNGIPVSVTSFPITVGAGAAGGTGPNAGSKGSSSIFGPITSTGGGGGGAIGTPSAPACRSGQPGGSGGGGSSQTGGPGGSGNTPPVSPPQGNGGGAGSDTPPDVRAGSGGGATASGTSGSAPFNQAAGAAGATTNISGSPVGYSGGGGGGGVQISPRAGGAASPCGSGGAGAPGNGPFTPSPSTNNGADNRGGGAGGVGADPSAPPSNTGGTGGSGVVIIRYRFQ